MRENKMKMQRWMGVVVAVAMMFAAGQTIGATFVDTVGADVLGGSGNFDPLPNTPDYNTFGGGMFEGGLLVGASTPAPQTGPNATDGSDQTNPSNVAAGQTGGGSADGSLGSYSGSGFFVNDISVFGLSVDNSVGNAQSVTGIGMLGNLELWRTTGNVGTTSPIAETFQAQVALNASSVLDTSASWTNFDPFDLTHTGVSGALPNTILNGNALSDPLLVADATLPFAVNPGDTLFIRWLDFTQVGTGGGTRDDQMLTLDNLQIFASSQSDTPIPNPTPQPGPGPGAGIPEPATATLSLMAMGLLAMRTRRR